MEQVLYQLPGGWEWHKLEEVVEKTENLNPLKDANKLWTYIDISSIDRDQFAITDPKEILGKEAPSRAKKHIQKNDVIFATTRPNLKNIALVREEYSSPVASTGFCVLRTNEKVLSAYLFYFVTSDFLQDQIEPFVSGASYPAITDGDLKKASIPIPSVGEQERIVEKLDALLTRINTAIEHLQESTALADALYASELSSVFSSGLDRWPLREFNDVAKVERGKSKHRPRNDKLLFGGEYPFIQTGDVRNAQKYITTFSATYNEKGLKQSRLWPKDTICLTIAANIGSVAILGMDACFPDSVVGISSTELDTDYLYYFLTTLQQQLDSKANAAAQKNINLKILSDIKIPVPTLDVQKIIARRFNEIDELAVKVKAEISEKITLMQQLKSSILDSAFKGKL
ncbi:restriction endonuclease subunit S [Pusillimonas sp. MFBS29]|uniref:restriction endonuclease subunit S n=1 Tax=Pusillimonas sp. MFBS29 TaxID=2886690 RepID=UPI001D109DF8|nr:restriction endonuclease subunit S [Pusillimonas sp. MFBS29]MCC2594723.1 restriction endonuclease subunit S [Pusillimonas sp. MFBS29]